MGPTTHATIPPPARYVLAQSIDIAVGASLDVVDRLARAGNDPCDGHHHLVARCGWDNAPRTIGTGLFPRISGSGILFNLIGLSVPFNF